LSLLLRGDSCGARKFCYDRCLTPLWGRFATRGNVLASEQLLSVLADGEFHSGEELGGLLGVSRAAVWKQLQKLEELSLSIEAQKGRGYRVVGGLDLLNRELIAQHADQALQAILERMEIFGVLDSTNLQAAKRIAMGPAHQYCCTAEQQTAGRGRRGRQWLSPFGRSLYCSLVWEFSNGAAALEGLSLCIGVAVANALSEAGVDGISLKWPNDVLLDGEKLGGILLEMQGDPAGVCQVIIGVGLNMQLQEVDSAVVTQPWADLSAYPIGSDRNRMLALLLNALFAALTQYSRQGFSPFRDQWQALDAFRGQSVKVQLGEEWLFGTEDGVNPDGGLRLITDSGVRVFHGGEVSLREVC